MKAATESASAAGLDASESQAAALKVASWVVEANLLAPLSESFGSFVVNASLEELVSVLTLDLTAEASPLRR